MKQTSHNTNRAAEEEADRKSQAQLLKEANDRFEHERNADPNWTAVITYRDDKTLKRKWMRNKTSLLVMFMQKIFLMRFINFMKSMDIGV